MTNIDLSSRNLKQSVCEESRRGFEWHENIIAAARPLEKLGDLVDLAALVSVAKRVQIGRCLAITFVSKEYMDVGLNWVAAMRRLNLSNFVVICGDQDSAEKIASVGAQVVETRLPLDDYDQDYLSHVGFSNKGLGMTTLKFPIVHRLLAEGLNIILSDSDAIWLKNPISWLRGDIAFQRIANFPSAVAQMWGFAACSGFIFFRSTPQILDFLSSCLKEQAMVQSDQIAFNLALLNGDVLWEETQLAHLREPPGALTKNNRLKLFEDTARLTFVGRLARHDLSVEALPHDLFWRHKSIHFDRQKVVISHPNTIKQETAKMCEFRNLGTYFLENKAGGCSPRSILPDQN